MKPLFYAAAILFALLTMGTNTAFGQFAANAGRDTTICAGSTVLLGGNPTAIGGRAPYRYAWNHGAPAVANPSVAPAVTTTYIVTVTDSVLNTATDSVTVTVNPIPTTTFTATSPVCTGQNSTIIYTGNASSGAAYNWNFAGGTIVSGSGQGPYQIEWASAGNKSLTLLVIENGCYSTVTTYRVAVNAPATSTFTVQSPVCVNTGSYIHYTGNGDTSSTYNWNFFGGTITGQGYYPFGPYDVTWNTPGIHLVSLVVTQNGCPSTTTYDSITVLGNNGLHADSVSTHEISCFGGTNGSACVYISGGTLPYQPYEWSNGDTGRCLTALSAGIYRVTMYDGNGCAVYDSAIVTQPTRLVDSIAVTNISCNGTNNGAACAHTEGTGTPGYTYLWSNGATSQCINGLTAGTYTSTVIDANGCSATATCTIAPAGPLQDSILITNAACYGGMGAMCDYVLNGNAPYTYHWNEGDTIQCISSLNPGTYTVTVTDASSCSATASATITQPAQLTTDMAIGNVTCFGGTNGILVDSVFGGSPAYHYAWSNNMTDEVISNLTAGTYHVTVTDSHGCTATDSATITQPAQLTLQVTTSGTSILPDTVSIIAGGGAKPYAMHWGNGQSTGLADSAATYIYTTPGIYTIDLVDNNGCYIARTVTVDTSSLSLTVHISASDTVICSGSSVTLTASTSGGIGTIFYAWSSSASLSSHSTRVVTSAPASTSVYTVTVTDTLGHRAAANITVVVNPLPTSMFTATSPVCAGQPSSITYTGNANTGATYNWNFAGGNIVSGSGQGPYQVEWASSGSKSVTLSVFENGCTSSTVTAYRVTVTPPPSAIFTTQSPVCVNSSSNIVFTGGIDSSATYTWNFDGGAITSHSGNPWNPYEVAWDSAGVKNISLVVTQNGCFSIMLDTVAVFGNNGLQVTSLTSSTISCNGASNGYACITVSGGTAPYQPYHWSNGETSQCMTNVTAGIYHVTLQDANGCAVHDSAVITQPSAIHDSITITNVRCNGTNNGSACAYVTGGTPGYTYAWSNGATSQCINGLTAGTYTITITDSHGCTATAAATVGSASPLRDSITVTNIACHGGSGALCDYVFNGTAPYTYLWSNSSTTQCISNLPGATFTITVTDAAGCSSTASATITQPALLTTTLATGDITCYGGANGVLVDSVFGGTPSYNYTWSNNMQSQVISGLTVGTYRVTVTDSHGCTATDSAAITQPAQLTLQVTSSGVLPDTVTVIAGGGVRPYIMHWGNGQSTVLADSAATYIYTTPGIYTTSLYDNNGCYVTRIINVDSAIALAVYVFANDTAICHGSSVTLTANTFGGIGPISYAWSSSAPFSPHNAQVITSAPSSTSLYTVTVTDTTGHSATADITVVVNPVPSSTFTATSSVCVGQPSAITYTGNANAGATYNWNFAGGNIISGSGQGPYEVNWASSGNKNITLLVTENGCSSAVTTYRVTVNPGPSATFTAQSPVCVNSNSNVVFTGTVDTGATYTWNFDGGIVTGLGNPTGPYEVAWDSAGIKNISLVVTQNGCFSIMLDTVAVDGNNGLRPDSMIIHDISSCSGSNSGSACVYFTGGTLPYQPFLWSNGDTGQCINTLSAGVYHVTMYDAIGCVVHDSAVITQPSALHVSIAVTGLSCNGTNNGSACAYVSGGTPGYAYQWSNGATSQGINGLTAGSYTITIADAHGCTATATCTIAPAGPLFDTLTVTNIPCRGGIGSLCDVVLGGRPPYTYVWSDGQTGQCISNLFVGTYNVTATDTAGCTATASGTITQPATSVTAVDSSSIQGITCYGEYAQICVEGEGGVLPYTYLWNTGINTACFVATAGNYNCTVTDANGCSVLFSKTVTQPAQIVNLFTVIDVSCYGGSNGSITDSVIDGGLTYTIVWNHGGLTGSTISNLAPGTYEVTVTDSHSCEVEDTVSVYQPSPMQDSVWNSGLTCFGDSSGGICNFVSGGTAPYLYLWSNNTTGSCAFNLAAGFYQFTVTDNNGCQIIDTASITQPSQVYTSGIIRNVTCNGGSNGSITVRAYGGYSPYFYNWSNASTSDTISNLHAGNYFVTVTDGNGCTAAMLYIVDEPAQLTDTINAVACSLCNTTSGGHTPYVYSWSNGSTGQCVGSLQPATYNCTVSDINGCTATASAIFTSSLQLQVLTPDSNAVPDSVRVMLNGGVSPFTFAWGDGQTNSQADSNALHIYQAPGVFLDSITDAEGCVITYRVDAGCSDQCVWPGDANYDGIVNNVDLLNIGVGYDSTGYTRLNPTINFIPQYCQNWPDTFIGPVNFKHADCNGDGIINAADTEAIVLNYSLTHVRGGDGQTWKADAPGLYATTSPDTVLDGQILTATLSLGDQAMPVTGAYGVAFSFNFDPLVVDTTDVQMTFPNSWIFGPGNHIDLSKNFYRQGQIQAAITRINHIGISGYGPICTVSMKITTGNINGKNMQYYLMHNYITNLVVIDSAGNVLTVNEGADTAIVGFIPTYIIPVKNANAHIQIFPNPASDQLNVVSALAEIEEISIVDLAGQLVIHQNMQAASSSIIDISDLSAGVYLINIKAAGHEYHSRFVKVSAK